MKSTPAIKEKEASNLNAKNKDFTQHLKPYYTKLSNKKMDKAVLKAELSLNKKHMGNYERLQIDRNIS